MRPTDTIERDAVAVAYSLVADDADSYVNTIPDDVERVVVTGTTNDGNDWVVLPRNPRPLQAVTGWSVAAHELRTLAASNLKINNQDGDGTKEAAIPATTLWQATYISATIGWVLRAWDELGAPITAIVPD